MVSDFKEHCDRNQNSNHLNIRLRLNIYLVYASLISCIFKYSFGYLGAAISLRRTLELNPSVTAARHTLRAITSEESAAGTYLSSIIFLYFHLFAIYFGKRDYSLLDGRRSICSYPILLYHILSHPILSYPIVSYLISSYHILSNHIVSYPILSYMFFIDSRFAHISCFNNLIKSFFFWYFL